MSEDQHKQISEHAYYLWEQEGRPEGRDLDHWTAAQQHVTPSQANEGEGNRTAARAYNHAATTFAETGPVEQQARKAKADLDGPEGAALRAAEAAGRRHSHGEDQGVSTAQPQ